MILLPAVCFLVILLAQISEKGPMADLDKDISTANKDRGLTEGLDLNELEEEKEEDFYVDILDMDLFPGPHSERREKRRRKKKKKKGWAI